MSEQPEATDQFLRDDIEALRWFPLPAEIS